MLNDDDPDRTTAQMDPNLKLRVDGELAAADGKDDDVPRYRPQARAMLGKKIPSFHLTEKPCSVRDSTLPVGR
jgi:hypothetical protein